MNYTENYHLPQWEKPDRIMMNDFNDAFQRLEAAAMRWDRLHQLSESLARDVYRRAVRHRLDYGPGGLTDSMWINTLSTREEAGDGHGWNGSYGVCANPKPATAAGILNSVEQVLKISTVPGYTLQSRKAVTSFTSDGFGTLEKLAVYTWMHSNYVSSEFSYMVRMRRMDSGEVVSEAGPFQSKSSEMKILTLNFPLEMNAKYQVEFELPEDLLYHGTAEFIIGADSIYNHEAYYDRIVSVTGRKVEPTVIKAVTAPAYAKCATGVMRWNGKGGVGLFINGTPLTIIETQDSTNGKDINCKETEFFAASLPEGNLTVKIALDGEAEVFDYGLIWK